MLKYITTEFQKLKRYSIILVGMIGVACSPVISLVSQNIMSDDAKAVLNYTFPDLLNSTIWNNMTIFFPMILALIGGYMINSVSVRRKEPLRVHRKQPILVH